MFISDLSTLEVFIYFILLRYKCNKDTVKVIYCCRFSLFECIKDCLVFVFLPLN